MQLLDYNVLFPDLPESSRLLVGCRRADYSASSLSRAVEDCDAHIINLNVTSLASEDMPVVVELRINRRSTQAVARSLERYGFSVLEVDERSEADDSEMRRRLDQLIHYLNI